MKDKDSSQINAIIQKFKQSIDTSIKNLGENDPKLSQQAYGELLSLANGKFPASTSTPTGTPAPAQVNDNTVTHLISLNNIHDKIAEIILSNTNNNGITKIIQDAFNKGKSITDIRNLINKSSKISTTIRNAKIKPKDLDAKAKKLIDVIAFNIEHF